MPIPEFDPIHSILPPHLGMPNVSEDCSPYSCTATELRQRFGATVERRSILLGFMKLREALVQRGIGGFQWLDGSFVEDVETAENRVPNDLDVVTFVRSPADATMIATALGPEEFMNPVWCKSRYRVDHFAVPLCLDGEELVEQTRYWYGLFSHRRDGRWKGMLRIPLAYDSEEASLLASLQGGQP